MVPDIKNQSVKINSKKFEFGKNFNTSRILRVENGDSAWAHNSFKNCQYFVRSLNISIHMVELSINDPMVTFF